MTTNDELNKREEEQITAAWARLEQQLQASVQSPRWQQWEEQVQSGQAAYQEKSLPSAPGTAQQIPAPPALSSILTREHANSVPLGRVRATSGGAASKTTRSGAVRRWLKRNAGKTAAACAAAIITVVIATPSTNEALAAWLNTFRMDNVMVVQENDLESLMNSFLKEGETLEMSNRFGDFEQTSHGKSMQLTPEKAAKQLGFDIPALKVADSQVISISSASSRTFTFSLKVDEINNAMRKLGADKLLPSSVDGKPITFDTGKNTNISYSPQEGDPSNLRVWMNYLETPTIQVDPSVDVKDAFEAVVRFPALPDQLRTSLLQASSLEEGEIPMPLITNGDPGLVSIKGIDVYVEYMQSEYASATWLEKGYIVTAGFRNYGDAQRVETLLSEMIRP